MKKILLLFSCSLFFIPTQAQNTFANAKALVKMYKNQGLVTDTSRTKQSAITFFEILKRQYTFEENVTPRDILNDYKKDKNEYLLKEVESMFLLLNETSDSTNNNNKIINNLQSQRKVKMDSVIGIVKSHVEAIKLGSDNSSDPLSAVLGRVQKKNKSPLERRLNTLEFNRKTIDIDRRIWGNLSQNNKRIVLDLKKDLFDLDLEIRKYEKSDDPLSNFYDLGDDKSFSDRYISSGTVQPIDVSKTVIVQSSAASLQTSIIDATATFIAERMKEELNVAFFDRFEKFIEDKNVRLLFPTTFDVLHASEASNYALMIKIVKDAFEDDLKNVVFNAPSFLSQTLEYSKEADSLKIIVDSLYRDWYEDQSKLDSMNNVLFNFTAQISHLDSLYEASISGDTTRKDQQATLLQKIESKNRTLEDLQKQIKESQFAIALKETDLMEQDRFKTSVSKLFKYLTLSVEMLKKIKEGQHPAKLLAFLRYNVDDIVPNSEDLKSSLTMLDIISQSLFTSIDSSKSVWIGIKELSELKSNPTLRRFYLGLVYQQIQLNLANDYNLIRADEISIDQAIAQAKRKGHQMVP